RLGMADQLECFNVSFPDQLASQCLCHRSGADMAATALVQARDKPPEALKVCFFARHCVPEKLGTITIISVTSAAMAGRYMQRARGGRPPDANINARRTYVAKLSSLDQP